MKIKICGLKEAKNIVDVTTLQPDYVGFIFYPKSPRYITESNIYDTISDIRSCNKVAVFVNEDIKNIIRITTFCNINYIQLHGDESPQYCEELTYLDYKIIKAFGIHADFDFSILNEYEDVCDYFLFDTKTNNYGGSGKPFSWEILQNYKLNKPIFLSGGIGPNNLSEAIELAKQIPIVALDLNSKLEIAPGIKDLNLVEQAIATIRTITI